MAPRGKRLLAKVMLAGTRLGQRLRDRVAVDCPLPDDDGFYGVGVDIDLAAVAPGHLLESRSIRVRNPWVPSGTAAWQLRYRSTDTDGEPVWAVATLLVPGRPWTRTGPRPLLSYQCAIDSLGSRANPSLGLRRGTQRELPMMSKALRKGWAVVTSDYTGPTFAFGAGLVAARLVLDGLRAALAFEPAGLAPGTPVAMWGYSGGGQATMWAGEQQPSYAPELNVAAIVAGGVPSDVRSVRNIDGTFFSGLSLAATVGISRAYPQTELVSRLNERGLRVLDEIADMTVDELVAYFPYRRVSELSTVPDLFETEGARRVAEQLRLGRERPTAPLLLVHATRDQIIPIQPARELADTYRRAGVDVTFIALRCAEHMIGAMVSARPSLRFVERRLATAPRSVSQPSRAERGESLAS